MLILSRKPGESILIGGEVEVVVLGQNGNSTRLGIVAPKSVEILRKELSSATPQEGDEHA